jgi:hypothetical protein
VCASHTPPPVADAAEARGRSEEVRMRTILHPPSSSSNIPGDNDRCVVVPLPSTSPVINEPRGTTTSERRRRPCCPPAPPPLLVSPPFAPTTPLSPPAGTVGSDAALRVVVVRRGGVGAVTWWVIGVVRGQ